MHKRYTLLAMLAAGAVVSGCASQQQMLQAKQPVALDAALARGRLDLNYPQATATVLSSDFIQPGS